MGSTLDNDGIANSLLRGVREEASFRRRVTGFIAAILKSDAPNSFKLYVVLLLFVLVCVSCDMTVFLADGAKEILRGPPPLISPALCLLGLGLCLVVGGMPAPFLAMRMAAFEEARLLEKRLNDVQHSKHRRKPRESAPPYAGDQLRQW